MIAKTNDIIITIIKVVLAMGHRKFITVHVLELPSITILAAVAP
jgi:hypothetical protein